MRRLRGAGRTTSGRRKKIHRRGAEHAEKKLCGQRNPPRFALGAGKDMTLRLHAHARLADVAPEALTDATVVVIDVLRATTTMVTALANGAREIVACASIEEAREKAAALGGERGEGAVVTGGERKGTKIEGFDLGNSPKDYTPERIGGKSIVFTTTNGTVALHHARQAKRVLIGALVNRAMVAKEAATSGGEVHLLCAGTGGKVSLDDCLTAGAIADELVRRGAMLDDTAALFRHAWREMDDEREWVTDAFTRCKAGRNLIDVGLSGDTADCVQIDTVPVVGEMVEGRIVSLREKTVRSGMVED
jgi:2-phosphosulfolactate phosphatase